MRYLPVCKPIAGAPYPISPILPDVLRYRRTNHGFESVAASPDGKTVYIILQKPMGDEAAPRYAGSRIVRLIELDFSDPLNARVTGMFLMRAGSFTSYPESKRQDQVKINDAKWLGPRRLLVLEQAKGRARLVVIDLSDATNVLTHRDAGTLRFEDVSTDLAGLNIRTAKATSVFDTADIPEINSDKLEGLALFGPKEVALSNDNDFGIGDNTTREPSKVWVIRLPEPLR